MSSKPSLKFFLGDEADEDEENSEEDREERTSLMKLGLEVPVTPGTPGSGRISPCISQGGSRGEDSSPSLRVTIVSNGDKPSENKDEVTPGRMFLTPNRSSINMLKSYLDNQATKPSRPMKLPVPVEKEEDSDDDMPMSDSDHYQMYVEMDELCHVMECGDWVWLQKARWMKYEEDVEAEAQRWGNPHVPSLSFYSLVEFRKYIKQGVVLLDVDVTDIDGLATAVTTAWQQKGLLNEEEAEFIQLSLKLPHKHLNKKGQGHFYKIAWVGSRLHGPRDSFSGMLSNTLSNHMNNNSGKSSEQSSRMSTPQSQTPQMPRRTQKINTGALRNQLISAEEADDVKEDAHRNKNIAERHLGTEAEGTVMLTGYLDALRKPVMAMVRLAEARDFGDLLEATTPLRFAFILFGPPPKRATFHETGRSICTLMTNKQFQSVAYKVKKTDEVLTAVDDFLERSIVVPPGQWDKEQLLPSIIRARAMADIDQSMEESPLSFLKDLEALAQAPGVNPLRRTGRLFGGMINDIKRRYPLYWSDVRDGLNAQCIATFFFLYFACLAPAITFGGLLSVKTKQHLGISETLVGVSVLGVLFHLLAAQPLTVLGTTGPVLIFEESLTMITEMVGWEYMAFRFWVCVWLFVVTFIVVMFEGSFFVKYITRFTEEIFAFLISLIFIYEVFNKLSKIFAAHPLRAHYEDPWQITCDEDGEAMFGNFSDTSNATSGPASQLETFVSSTTLSTMRYFFSSSVLETTRLAENATAEDLVRNGTNATFTCAKILNADLSAGPHPNTALLSLVLTFCTFIIAYFFRIFRNMHFLGKTARRVLSDFGVPIAIIVMVCADLLESEVYTQKLDVPGGLSVTDSMKRGWIINPLGRQKPLPIEAIFAAIIPAILVFILIYLETQITSIIVNKRTKKGSGFHFDLMLIGVFSVLCGLFGFPLISFATVRSISHVNALCVYSRVVAPGDKPKLVEVKEQRLTGIFAHILIGVSILMGPVLRAVPLAVLFGVFLYMGVTSLFGMQLTQRIILFLKPVKHHPNVPYVTKIRSWRMHIFTLIQVGFLVVLWAVKSSPASLAFPFVLLLAIPVRRFLLKYIFTKKELKLLDMKD